MCYPRDEFAGTALCAMQIIFAPIKSRFAPSTFNLDNLDHNFFVKVHFKHKSPYEAGCWPFPDVLHCQDVKASERLIAQMFLLFSLWGYRLISRFVTFVTRRSQKYTVYCREQFEVLQPVERAKFWLQAVVRPPYNHPSLVVFVCSTDHKRSYNVKTLPKVCIHVKASNRLKKASFI